MSSDLFRSGEFDAFLEPGGALSGPFARELRRAASAGSLPEPGALVGRYRVLREVGRGGMSAVFLAERADGAFQQQVALKLLLGFGGEDARRRFERERHILASLNHPNIARLLDGGFEEGLGSYIVMEFVEGQPIDRYCDGRRLDLAQRLALFGVVCQAVAYAHRNLVVHRDLKPSNVFVTGDGQVKLLDFGIAKLLEAPAPDGAAAREHTETRHVLTPGYAAPEQLRGDPITTATDVYQLGLLLYEILTGRRAHATGRGALTDVVRVVCFEEPRRPSDAAQAPAGSDGPAPEEAALARASTPRGLARKLTGDLDTIVLTALRKEPERRYGSPGDLAQDLRRFSDGLPVQARRGSWRYHALKFAQRHRLPLLALALVLVSLASGLGLTLWQAQVARREAQRAEEVKHVLLSLFTGANPDQTSDPRLTARELIQRGVKRIEALDAQPQVLSDLLWVAGVCYLRLGLYADAAPMLQRAYDVRARHFRPDSLELAEARGSLGELAYAQGRHADVEAHLRPALQAMARHADADQDMLSELTATLADSLAALGRVDEGLALLHARLALEESQRPQGAGLAQILTEIGTLRDERGDADAEGYFRRAIEIEERAGRQSQSLTQALHNLAARAFDAGRFEESETLLRRSIEVQERTLGADHFFVAGARGHLGVLLERKGDLDGAERAYRDARERFHARRPDHPFAVEFAGLLGKLLFKRGRLSEAEPLLREAHEAQRRAPDAFEPKELETVAQALVDCLTALGRGSEAESVRRRASQPPFAPAPAPSPVPPA